MVIATALVTVAVAAPVERMSLALEAPVPTAATPAAEEAAEDGKGALPAPTAPVPAGTPPLGETPATPDGRLEATALALEILTLGDPVPAAAPEAAETPGTTPLPAATPEAAETPGIVALEEPVMAATREAVEDGRPVIGAALEVVRAAAALVADAAADTLL